MITDIPMLTLITISGFVPEKKSQRNASKFHILIASRFSSSIISEIVISAHMVYGCCFLSIFVTKI